jgi:lysozyme
MADAMQLSAQGLDLIKRSEGFRAAPYLDVAGHATIGYGHRVVPPESFPAAITEAQAAALLVRDVGAAQQAVARLVHVPLTQGQFDALVDFCFNVGSGNLASSTLLRELNAGEYDIAGLEFLRWDYAGSAPNPGLKARRTAELQLWTG